MKSFYLDVSGDRGWAGFRNSCDLLGTQSSPSANDLVFIHAKDLLNADKGRRLGVLKERWDPLCACVRDLKEKPLGNGKAAIVLVSGDFHYLNSRRDDLYKILEKHDAQRIRLCDIEIPHRSEPEILESLLGKLVDDISQITDIRQETVERCGDLLTAFRYLWQAYALATTNEDVPNRLRPLRIRLQAQSFSREYWAPILSEEGRLEEQVGQSAEEDLKHVIGALRFNVNWDSLCVAGLVDEYCRHWFSRVRKLNP